MSHKQYFKVFDPLVKFPPAEYCPANGMLDPEDPNFAENLNNYPDILAITCPANNYIPDPTLNPPQIEGIEIGTPETNEILLLCSNGGDRKISFQVSGAYNVEITGNSGIFFTQSKTAGSVFTYTFPAEQALNGTYKVRIYSSGNNITSFAVSTISGNPFQNWKILEAKFNTPYITTLSSAFYNINDLVSLRFESDMNSLTTIYRMCLNCLSLEWVSFKNLNSLVNMDTSFSGSGIKYITFPETLPLVNNLTQAFSSCTRLENIVYPIDMPQLLNMSSVHSSNSMLKTVTLPTTMNKLTTLANAFNYCTKLKSLTFPASLPELTTIASMLYNSNMIQNITMPNSAPKLATASYAFLGCNSLQTITMPNSLPLLAACDSMFQDCWQLQNVSIPSDSVLISTMSATFKNCYLLASMVLPNTLNSCISFATTFQNCYLLANVTLPTSISNLCTTMVSMFDTCKVLQTIVFPQTANGVTTIASLCNASGVVNVTLPQNMNALTNASYAFNITANLQSITMPLSLPAVTNMLNFVNSQGGAFTMSACTFGTNQVDCTQVANPKYLASFNFPTMRVSRLYITGGSPASGNALQTLEIDWTNSSYSGTSPQINAMYLNWTAAQLDDLFTKLPNVTGKAIAVSGAPGYATCNKTIATAKGWTVQ